MMTDNDSNKSIIKFISISIGLYMEVIRNPHASQTVAHLASTAYGVVCCRFVTF